jgi:Asparagine synthase
MKPQGIDERWTTGPTGLPVVPPADVARGWLFGYEPAREVRNGEDPAAALSALVRDALRRPPCIVSFSGGRDSSIVLGVAAAVAADEGLPAPVAVTFRYPGDVDAEESEHQERVIGHLHGAGLPIEWVRRDILEEFDLLGPMTAPIVAAHGGPTWPPVLGPIALLSRMAAGGSVLTGEFGDEVLGPQRVTFLRIALGRRGRGLGVQDWRFVGRNALPTFLYRWTVRPGDEECPWLSGPGRAAWARMSRSDATMRPLRWDRAAASHMRRRAVSIGRRTMQTVAGWSDCRLVEPLGDDRFVAALAGAGGWLGLSGRAAATQLVSGGRLPHEVVVRDGKSTFNGSRFGRVTQEFARTWDGTGLEDHDLDSGVLKRMWALGDFRPQSAMLLQQAWLSQQRVPVAG